VRLEKVEIAGFKSFCDRQELSFRAGVTGIVGPNGCGKSNISDAISWVLGEQSAKSLRGSSMEDVIFAGSQSRQPLGMAEVSLRVTGLNGNSPDGAPECLVTRRLYRNGDSEYLMNGQICRLRDIHELFMDTGLGSKAYSIIEQGKIGLILSSKPADRRALIEEAAGITKYKARRRQTALKLEAAQQNLLRVNDIVHEVEKQLESLKRQASKARRYRAVREEMIAVERVAFGLRFTEMSASEAALVERLRAEGERETAAGLALSTEEAQLEARRTALYDEEGSLTESRARLSEATLAVERHEGRSAHCREQASEAEERRKEAEQEAAELDGRRPPLLEQWRGRQDDERRLGDELSAATEEGRVLEESLAAAYAQQATAEAGQDAAREGQLTLVGRLAALANAREAASGNAERADGELLKLAAERADLEREKARVGILRTEADARRGRAEAELAALTSARDEAQARGAEARERADALAHEAESLQRERDSLSGRLSSLTEIVETHAAFDDGVRALLARPEGVEVIGVVADFVEAEPRFERAVEAFMADRLQAVLAPDQRHARAGLAFLESSGAGRGALLALASLPDGAPDAAAGDALRAAAAEPGVLGRLGDHYRLTGAHRERLRSALPDALVLETLDDALALAARHPAVPCVTPAGEVVRGALLEGGRGVKGLLAPRREVREIAERLPSLESTLGERRDDAQGHAVRAEAALAEARRHEDSIHAAEKELVAVRHELQSAEEEWQRLERKATVLDTERDQAEEEKGATAVRLSEIAHALATAEAEREAGLVRLGQLAAEVAAARAAAEAAQVRLTEARSQHAALRERGAAAAADARRLAEEHGELEARIAAARSRAEEMARRIEELGDERATAERLLAEALADRDRRQGEEARAEGRVRELRNELEGRELSVKERRREREMLREAMAELEVARARAESDLAHLGRECRQAVGVAAQEAAAALGDEDRGRSPAELEVQVQEYRQKLERMGPVNVLAVEQAQELEERHTFLTAQRQDLLDSITELDAAIKKIDRTSRERFKEAFEAINQHFSEIFRQLFGGGTAGLSLVDEHDLLESGIDVMAQPPGKRLQNVMLLSGGEKALTAIALLFAIFQHKPSPFCILDEVDAPLDDANIGRFVRMLEGLKDQTQFVLITHSRKTMAIADQLYGVTMEEPGVSKLVSVRFG
jgi:chromosome segregation protein